MTFDEIAAEIGPDLTYLRNSLRQVRDLVERTGSLLAEQDAANFNDKTLLEQKIVKSAANVTAGYIKYLELASGPGGAIAQSLEALYAAMGGNTAEVLVRWGAESTPVGVTAQWGLQLSTDDGETFGSSAILAQVKDGESLIVLDADRTVISSDGGETIAALFEDGTTTIRQARIGDASIETAKIADAAITEAKIGSAAITEAKIASAAITEAKIADAAITSAKVGTAAITSAKIGDLQVETVKIASAAVTALYESVIDSPITFPYQMAAYQLGSITVAVSDYPTSVGCFIDMTAYASAGATAWFQAQIVVTLNGSDVIVADTGRKEIPGGTRGQLFISWNGLLGGPGNYTFKVRILGPGTIGGATNTLHYFVLSATAPKK